MPDAHFPKVEWRAADVGHAAATHFDGADAVVHLAWLIQPGRDQRMVARGERRRQRAGLRARRRGRRPLLVYASSVGAYAPGPKDRAVDESWPTTGIESSFYSRHKAEVERLLDGFEREHPAMRMVRLRPGLIFKREAASGIRRLFAGPLLPGAAAAPGR